MIRILHVVGNMDYGGVETLLMNIYRTLGREQLQFDFLCHNDRPGKYDAEIRSLGGQIHRIPGIGESSLRSYRRSLRQAFLELDDHRIVHSHLNLMNGVVLREAKAAGIPIRISHSHSHGAKYGLLRGALRRYSGLLIKGAATHGFACSVPAAEFVHRGRLLKSTRIMNNAIHTAQFEFSPARRAAVRQELGMSESLIVGHVGRFEKQKNHQFVLEIFEKLSRIDATARLMLVGVGSLEEKVRESAAARGIADRVHFLGARNDVKELMDAMDVFLFPSLFEGLGIVAVEAQANGLLTLASEFVPRETNLTDLIEYLPIDRVDPWLAAIENSRSAATTKRQDFARLVADGGYDVKAVAKDLQRFYVDSLNSSASQPEAP